MFLGTHYPRLDDKGRLALPAKFRTELEGGLVICKGHNRCLSVFPVAEFREFIKPLRAQGVRNPKVREYSRILLASASQETTDGQGRITVPQPLRAYAGLTKECAVIGADFRFEIWDAATWQAYLDEREGTFADVDEEVLPEP